MSPFSCKMEQIFALTDAERDVLDAACTRTETFQAGADIIVEGDRPWVCNLLLEGTVFRYKLRDGRRQILAFQYPGDLFDAYSFVLEVMDHSIAALTDCEIAIIPHEAMLEITETHSRIARAVWKDTLIDAAVFSQWMSNARSMPPAKRIAHLICEMCARRDVIGGVAAGRVEWPMSAVDVSDALDVLPGDVESALASFERDGLIAREAGALVIRDHDKLARFGEFDPGYLHLEPPLGPASRAPTDWVKPL